MKKLVERFAEEGAITNQKAAHDLNVHLTAVNLFEEKEVAEKVVKHLQGFNHLLDHQKENEWLSKEAYLVLKADTDYLIRKWQ